MAGLFLPLIHPETMAGYLFWIVLAVGVFFLRMGVSFWSYSRLAWLGGRKVQTAAL